MKNFGELVLSSVKQNKIKSDQIKKKGEKFIQLNCPYFILVFWNWVWEYTFQTRKIMTKGTVSLDCSHCTGKTTVSSGQTTGVRDHLLYSVYTAIMKESKTTTNHGFHPTFHGALAWIRMHTKEIRTLVNLIRIHPELMQDQCLDPVWALLEPMLELSQGSNNLKQKTQR